MIEFNSNLYEVGVTLIVTLIFLGLGLLLALCPHTVVSLLARWLRTYQRVFRLSDSQLDRMALPFQRSMLGDSVSQFKQVGIRSPKEFPALIAYARTFGAVIAVIVALVLCLVLGLLGLSLLVGKTS